MTWKCPECGYSKNKDEMAYCICGCEAPDARDYLAKNNETGSIFGRFLNRVKGQILIRVLSRVFGLLLG